MELTLYTHPGTCARVTMIALEEIGLPFKTELVRFMKQEHLTKEYREKNPLGKVPSLTIDGQDLHENVAILLWLNEIHPEAHLLPVAADAVAKAQITADLCFCSSTLHPIVTRIAVPMMFGPPEAVPAIRASAEGMMRRYLTVIEDRLQTQGYWYATGWSIMDAYISWVYGRITGQGFDASAFPQLNAMMARQASRSSVMRAAALDAEHQAQLEREGATMNAAALKSAFAAIGQ